MQQLKLFAGIAMKIKCFLFAVLCSSNSIQQQPTQDVQYIKAYSAHLIGEFFITFFQLFLFLFSNILVCSGKFILFVRSLRLLQYRREYVLCPAAALAFAKGILSIALTPFFSCASQSPAAAKATVTFKQESCLLLVFTCRQLHSLSLTTVFV